MYFDKDICNTAAIEYALLKELSETDEQRNINLINHQKTAFLLNIMKNNNLNEMINTERTIILNELNYYKDSLAMENSYIKAIQDINLMLYKLPAIHDPEQYKFIADSCFDPRNQKNGLPYDEVRKGFASHYARLVNRDKETDHLSDKSFLQTRMKNWKAAEKLYISLQKAQVETLGWKPDFFRMSIEEVAHEIELKRQGIETTYDKKFLERTSSGYQLAQPSEKPAMPNPTALKHYLRRSDDATQSENASDTNPSSKFRPG